MYLPGTNTKEPSIEPEEDGRGVQLSYTNSFSPGRKRGNCNHIKKIIILKEIYSLPLHSFTLHVVEVLILTQRLENLLFFFEKKHEI